MSNRQITVEFAQPDSNEHYAEIMALLIMLHGECGYAPIDSDKLAQGIVNMVADGHVIIARCNGQAVGVLGLTESSFWYSKTTCLWGIWFYVLPEFRGFAGHRLMTAAAALGEQLNLLVFVSSSNPNRRAKHKFLALEAQMSGFVPTGYTLRLR